MEIEYRISDLNSSISFCFVWSVLPPSTEEESVFLAFRQSVCSMVFSGLTETNASLQITANSVLTSLAQQSGGMQQPFPSNKILQQTQI